MRKTDQKFAIIHLKKVLDAASFVKLDSSLSIRYGPAIVFLAILPILWIVSPSGTPFKMKNDESE